ncbi:semaphorin-7A-like isoform X1 [Paramormyrops kingsleyae]|uniref:semaphorin-7A-like isoform X1 n=2 Tax=Paramormyrops kingsleyae TaxID=1676925 RepID=UPI003B979EA3
MRYFIFCSLFFIVFAEKGPRLKFVVHESAAFQFTRPQLYSTVRLLEGEDVLYVGGQATLYMLKFTGGAVRHAEIPISSEEKVKEACLSETPQSKECDNFITVVEKIDGYVMVCGTNAGHPKCWMLVNGTAVANSTVNGVDITAADVASRIPSQPSVSLTADGNFYSAITAEGHQPGFIRRTFGPRRLITTENKWLQNPRFVGAAVIPGSVKHKEEIYFFFSEINKTANVDKEPYRACIGRVCMIDEGGIKGTLENSWTTFLKARLMCGSASRHQQFNNLKQAFVLTAREKRTGVMYGLFANAWDVTVVCAYSVEDIDLAFSTSRLKGYRGILAGYRPGMCTFKNVTTSLNAKTLGVIRDHPEIEDVIWPIGLAPLDLPTGDRFTKIVADTVLAVNEEHYSVVYLGTESGKVLKVLHTIEEAFIISQYSAFRSEGPVTAVAIDSERGYLYVSSPTEVQRIPLADCGRYGDGCRGCILSRDPYCGWDVGKRMCVVIPKEYNISTGMIVQSLDQSSASECGESAAGFAGLRAHSTSPKEVEVDVDGPVLLPCPVYSFHASYLWEKDHCTHRYPCSILGDSCVLSPMSLLPFTDGIFRCMALEDGHKVEVVSYKVIINKGPVSASVTWLLRYSLFLFTTPFWFI